MTTFHEHLATCRLCDVRLGASTLCLVGHDLLGALVTDADAARAPRACQWTVTAGRVSGETDPSLDREFFITRAQWAGGRAGAELFFQREGEAAAYARHLQLRGSVGPAPRWVHVLFEWL